MTHYMENVRDWMDEHGVLAQIKRGVHINNIEAEIQNLRRENEQLREEIAQLKKIAGEDGHGVLNKIQNMHGIVSPTNS